jgi:hypothetical protein
MTTHTQRQRCPSFALLALCAALVVPFAVVADVEYFDVVYFVDGNELLAECQSKDAVGCLRYIQGVGSFIRFTSIDPSQNGRSVDALPKTKPHDRGKRAKRPSSMMASRKQLIL